MLLCNLQIFYERLVDKSFLCVEEIRAEFERLEESPESWRWLSKLQLIALHLAHYSPAECL